MDKLKSAFLLIGIGIVVGVIGGWVLFSLGAEPTGVEVGPVKFEIPTEQPTQTIQPTQPVGEQTVVPTSPPATVQEAPTVVIIPTATSVPPSTSPPSSSTEPWIHSVGQIPATGTQVTWDLNEGEVLILTGGRVRFGDFYCGDDRNQICVVIIQATRRQGVTINDLIAQNNWLGVTNIFNPEETLSDVQPLFWRTPNCVSGCSKATVCFFKDDRRIDIRTIQSP